MLAMRKCKGMDFLVGNSAVAPGHQCETYLSAWWTHDPEKNEQPMWA